MQEFESGWTATEKTIAKAAFETAHKREVIALLKQVRTEVNEIVELEDLWRLHDFLSAKRHEIDGKYDYNYSVLLFVFAELVRDGWLQLDELKDLDKDKLAKIAALTGL